MAKNLKILESSKNRIEVSDGPQKHPADLRTSKIYISTNRIPFDKICQNEIFPKGRGGEKSQNS